MSGYQVGIVTVNYGDPAHTAAFAESLAQLSGVDRCRVLVVNNGALRNRREPLEHALAPIRDRVRVFHVEQNLYYWGGVAFALASEWPRAAAMPPWVIACNNDIVIEDRHFIERLLTLDREQYAVVAPAIISAVTGRDQNPFLRKPWGFLERLKWHLYYTHYAVAQALLLAYAARRKGTALLGVASRHIGLLRRPRTAQEETIYAPHGAFVIFSRSYFARGGALDTTVPMYAEEMTVGEIAKRVGARVVYYPELRVVHREHGTAGERLTPAKYHLERLAHHHFYAAYWNSEPPHL